MLNFFAAINHFGYGVFAYNLMRAYHEQVSKDIALFPVEITSDFVNNPDVQYWLSNAKRFKRSDPSLMIFQAPWLNRFAGTPRIGFPIFELDIFPEYDLSLLRALDAILQPSQWGKKILENHGLKNIHIVPGGYDPKTFSPSFKINQKMQRIKTQGVSFVHVGKWEPRKSSEEILSCFIQACDNGKLRANLLFHVQNPFDEKWFSKVNQVLTKHQFTLAGTHFVRGNTRILVPQEPFPGGLKKLYQMAEFGIWASKAEGWNLPLMECIASGCPSLTTNNTAQADFIKEEVYPPELIIQSHQKEPTRLRGRWWSLDENEIIQKIQTMIRDPEKFLKMENRCLESIKDFTWENSAKKLGEVIPQITC